jgi:hypothetical protein
MDPDPKPDRIQIHWKCCIRIHNTDRFDTVILGLLGKGSLDTPIKKENQIFLIYKEIQNGAVAMSYMRKGFLI